ncbi:MAG: hypothetical protein LH645_01050 [Actinomycetia bacterium]|nr:hypothetical protein [Actinomycetes bacterium]
MAETSRWPSADAILRAFTGDTTPVTYTDEVALVGVGFCFVLLASAWLSTLPWRDDVAASGP